MAHVAAWKKDMVSELVQDMREYPVVAVVDMEGPLSQSSTWRVSPVSRSSL